MRTSRIVLETIGYMGLRGLLYGGGLGACYAAIFGLMPNFHVLIAIYGAFYGVIVGLPVGSIGGLIIGLVISRFLNPATNPNHFYYTIITLGALIAFGGSFLGFALLLGPNLIFCLIPALIAAASAMRVSHKYATRYLAETAIAA